MSSPYCSTIGPAASHFVGDGRITIPRSHCVLDYAFLMRTELLEHLHLISHRVPKPDV